MISYYKEYKIAKINTIYLEHISNRLFILLLPDMRIFSVIFIVPTGNLASIILVLRQWFLQIRQKSI